MKITSKKLDDVIPVFSARDQTIDEEYVTLGIDTEMRFAVNGKAVWPHLEGLGQERPKGKDADWHGDGYAFELCTLPSHCLETLAMFLGSGFLEMEELLARKYSTDDITLLPDVLYQVPDNIRDSAPDTVKRLGCSPSMNVYGDAGSPDTLGESIRTTGCHLHLTHESLDDNEKLAKSLVKWADVLVGNTWNYISPENPKEEALRRTAYGRAGEFRARMYPESRVSCYSHKGVEYRVLPGSVIKNPVYLTLCFNLYRTALRFALNHGNPPKEISEITQHAINTVDKDASKAVLDWLPFGGNAYIFFNLLYDKPLTTITLREWRLNGNNLLGHRYLAFKEKIINSQHEG